MKFLALSVLLISFYQLHAATFNIAESTREVYELMGVLQGMVVGGKATFDEVEEKTSAALENGKQEVTVFEQLVRSQIDREVKKVVKELEKYESESSICLKNVTETIATAVATAEEKLRTCIVNAVQRFDIIGENAKEHIAYSKAKVEEIDILNKECLVTVDVWQQIDCVFKRIPESLRLIGELLKDGFALITETLADTLSIVMDTKGCMEDIGKQSLSDLRNILNEIVSCVTFSKIAQ